MTASICCSHQIAARRLAAARARHHRAQRYSRAGGGPDLHKQEKDTKTVLGKTATLELTPDQAEIARPRCWHGSAGAVAAFAGRLRGPEHARAHRRRRRQQEKRLRSPGQRAGDGLSLWHRQVRYRSRRRKGANDADAQFCPWRACPLPGGACLAAAPVMHVMCLAPCGERGQARRRRRCPHCHDLDQGHPGASAHVVGAQQGHHRAARQRCATSWSPAPTSSMPWCAAPAASTCSPPRPARPMPSSSTAPAARSCRLTSRSRRTPPISPP